MIDDWREKWHTFTMEQTDAMFGFGFVQVLDRQTHKQHATLSCSLSVWSRINGRWDKKKFNELFQHKWLLQNLFNKKFVQPNIHQIIGKF